MDKIYTDEAGYQIEMKDADDTFPIGTYERGTPFVNMLACSCSNPSEVEGYQMYDISLCCVTFRFVGRFESDVFRLIKTYATN